MSLRFADVFLPLAVPGLFTYEVPDSEISRIVPGVRVMVSFGKGNKKYTGIVYKLHSQKPPYQIKPVLEVLDEYPVVTQNQMEWWIKIAWYYMANPGEVMQAALPSAFQFEESLEYYLKNKNFHQLDLDDDSLMICNYLNNSRSAGIHELIRLPLKKNLHKTLSRLIELSLIGVIENIEEKYKPKKESFIQIHPDFRNEKKLSEVFDNLSQRAFKQLEVLQWIVAHSGEDFSQSIKKSYITKNNPEFDAALREIIKKKIVVKIEETINRVIPSEIIETQPLKTLSQEQETALNEIKKHFEQNRPVLLHGVTGSGKTEIYLHLIKEYVERGYQVLYLLPEIALTHQIISRVKSVFGAKAGVYHSRFSQNERVEIWKEVLSFEQGRENYFQIVVGPRSAMFLPFKKLGLIIIDEEHDESFKQEDPSPRYNARDVCLWMSHKEKIPILLGSATPSSEIYKLTEQNKIARVQLTKRFNDTPLPEIYIHDMKPYFKGKNQPPLISPFLKDIMEKVLQRKKQIILFHHRRGYAPVTLCLDCEHVHLCHACDISLTYHKKQNRLYCHLCGFHRDVFQRCEKCGSPNIIIKGTGTEKVEEEVLYLFPQARIGRLDYDSTRTKGSYYKILSDFEDRKIDILIGTKMVTKGLDFDHVDLVGIVNADGLLSFPDFRASERALQTYVQVAGRSGRKKNGLVVIQTYRPTHKVFKYLVQNDYLGLIKEELKTREEFFYPPFVKLIQIQFRHKQQKDLFQNLSILAEKLRQKLGSRVLGPEEDRIHKVNNFYRYNLLIKILPKDDANEVKWIVKQNLGWLQHAMSTVKIHIDVDPY